MGNAKTVADLIARCNDADCRVNAVYPLTTAACTEELRDMMQECWHARGFDTSLRDRLINHGWGEDDLVELQEGDHDAFDAMLDTFSSNGHHLVWVQTSVPVKTFRAGATTPSYSYSWGRTYEFSCIAESYEDALAQSAAWAEGRAKYDEARASD